MSYNYNKFPGHSTRCKFIRTREEYSATPSGAFRKKPDSVETETVDGEFYTNFVRSIPFFNNRYMGECCRAEWNYTKYGYIPVRIVTSKKGYKKYVDVFRPVD